MSRHATTYGSAPISGVAPRLSTKPVYLTVQQTNSQNLYTVVQYALDDGLPLPVSLPYGIDGQFRPST